MTKVINSEQKTIPAGIFTGIEAFWHEGEKWVIANATVKRFDDCESAIQRPIYKAYAADNKSLSYLAKIGLTTDSEIFDRWYRCVVGGLDHVPDFDLKFTPDSYNNMCGDYLCPHRGRLCGRASGLKNYEVETLAALKQGESLERTAMAICVSLPGMKSRVEKIKEKWDVPNMAALMATATQLGI